ncbi:MAG: HAD hydrolase-like protein [Oscillospiraceae bacterium]
MGWDVLLFDLDGTLTDSGPGIMHAAETALGSFGITGLSEQALRQFVGPPLVESFAVYLRRRMSRRPSTASVHITARRAGSKTSVSRRAGMPARTESGGKADVRRHVQAGEHGAAGADAF